jgi:hypothetical protein
MKPNRERVQEVRVVVEEDTAAVAIAGSGT